MKKLLFILILIPVVLVILAFINQGKKKFKEVTTQKPRNGVAIILTGAAARIPQEAALLEELDKRGLLKNVVFISGVSSGALNSVVLNGILSKKITWEDYRTILYNLKNSNVFIQEDKKIPLNTRLARQLYTKIMEEKLGYYKIGDLPFTTSISFTHLEDMDLKKVVYRMCSRKINAESDTTLGLVDIAMASSAFPLVFPPIRIKNVKTIPDVDYVDGGIGEDHIPFLALLEFEKYRGAGVETVYIISRKSDSIPEVSEELKGLGINDNGIFDKMGFSFDAVLSKGIIKGLEEYARAAPELVSRTFVWIPEYNADFLMFNFDDLKKQYILTSQWAERHDPVRLGDFLLPFLLKNH